MQHNDIIVNDLTSSHPRLSAAIWLAGALVWLPAIAFLTLRAVLPWDGMWVSVIAPQPGQITVVRATPGSGLLADDVIVAVAGRTVGEALREAFRKPLTIGQAPGQPIVYRVARAGSEVEITVTRAPGTLSLPLRRWGILLFGIVFQLVGAFLLLRQPNDMAVQVIFLTAACLLSYSVIRAADLKINEILHAPSWWLYLLLGIVVNLGWQVGLVCLSLVFPQPHRWLHTHRGGVLAAIAAPLVVVAVAAALAFSAPADPVLALSGLATALLLAQLALFILAAIFFLTNYRTLPADDRQRARWVMLAFVAAIVAGVVLSTLPDVIAALARQPKLAPESAALRNNLIWVAALIIPLAFVVAVLRYQLFDIDLVINRALVWGALTTLTMGLYILIVGVLILVFHTSSSPLAFFLATGVVVVLFQPVRGRLQRAVNRLMYGERDDPYAVLSRLGQRLGGALAPDAVAPAIVESIGAALKLPYVALAIHSNDFSRSEHESTQVATTNGEQEPLAAWGKPPTYASIRLPLNHQGQSVGELILAPRGPGETFSLLDRRLLDDLAKQAGVALYAAQQTWQAQQLAADLQHSRERLVTAREEERRRLRRDLHDGLGPALASLTLKVDAARDELGYDTQSASVMLNGLKGDIQAAISDIRRLVYDLRPPALDDLGLAASVRLLAERYQGANLAITCDLPERLPPLPAAVEVAIYRITAEALTNVVRHAGASACRIRLTIDDRAELEVSDDGRGTPPDAAAGVGRVSMRERAAELGGECTIASAPGAGTAVRVWLPLPG